LRGHLHWKMNYGQQTHLLKELQNIEPEQRQSPHSTQTMAS
jgi:hypothetical protein